ARKVYGCISVSASQFQYPTTTTRFLHWRQGRVGRQEREPPSRDRATLSVLATPSCEALARFSHPKGAAWSRSWWRERVGGRQKRPRPQFLLSVLQIAAAPLRFRDPITTSRYRGDGRLCPNCWHRREPGGSPAKRPRSESGPCGPPMGVPCRSSGPASEACN